MSGLGAGRAYYRLQHPRRPEATTEQNSAGEAPAAVTRKPEPRRWTMEDLLSRPIDQGRCLWEAQHGNPHARTALEDLRNAVAGLHDSATGDETDS